MLLHRSLVQTTCRRLRSAALLTQRIIVVIVQSVGETLFELKIASPQPLQLAPKLGKLAESRIGMGVKAGGKSCAT